MRFPDRRTFLSIFEKRSKIGGACGENRGSAHGISVSPPRRPPFARGKRRGTKIREADHNPRPPAFFGPESS